MSQLPLIYKQIDSRLREDGVKLCAAMQAYLRDRGVETSNWRFDAETKPRLQSVETTNTPVAQPIVEFTVETGNERRKVVFLGPMFSWQPSLFTAVTPVGAMPQEQVQDFFHEIHDARDALCALLDSPQALGQGLVPWNLYGHRSNLMCVLDGVPAPAALSLPIEDVLPTGCVIHLVDARDGQATQAALAASEAVRRRGRRVTWIAKSPPLPSTLAPQSVEQAIQTWHASMSVRHPGTGEPDPPGLVVFGHPTELPLQEDVSLGGSAPVSPEAAVMWASVLPQMILRDTTVIVVNSVRGILDYPRTVPPDLQPWRTNAKYERVYGAEG